MVDRQNLANALLVGDPTLAKSLVGRGVPELDLMALRAAMGTGPFAKEVFDGETAVRALLALAWPVKQGSAMPQPETLARAGNVLAAANVARVRRLAAELVSADRETKWGLLETLSAAAEKASGEAKAGLERFERALRTAMETDQALRKSLDVRIYLPAGGKNTLLGDGGGGTYQPTFRVVDAAGNRTYDDVGGKTDGQGTLLATLAGDTPGVTVVEADGGSGKSLLLAQAVRGWLLDGADGSATVAYVDMAGLRIDADGKVEEIKKATQTANILILDSLDEAIWADDDHSQSLDKKREKFSTWLAGIAHKEGKKKKIVLTSRPGHWSGGGRRLRLPAYDDERANKFVSDYVSGHSRQEALTAEWNVLRTAAKTDQSLADIVGNPLTLLLLCEVATGNKVFDETKTFSWYASHVGHLFEDAARKRLEKWESGDKKIRNREMSTEEEETCERAGRLMDALGQLAYIMGTGWKVTEENVAELVPGNVKDILRALKKTEGGSARDVGPLGLLIQRDGKGNVAFAHEKMREYFAARHMRRLVEKGIKVPVRIIPTGTITPDSVPCFGNKTLYEKWKRETLAKHNLTTLTETCFVHATTNKGVEKLRGRDLAWMLCVKMRNGKQDTAREAMRVAVKKGLKGDDLKQVLKAVIRYGDLNTAQKAMQIGIEKLDGDSSAQVLSVAVGHESPVTKREAAIRIVRERMGNDEALAKVLRMIAHHPNPDTARIAIQIAVEKGLTGRNLAQVLEAVVNGDPDVARTAIRLARDKLEVDDFVLVLWEAARHESPDVAGDVMMAAVENGLEEKNLRIALNWVVRYGNLKTIQEAKRIATEKKLIGVEELCVARSLCIAIRDGKTGTAREAIKIAIDNGLKGWKLAQVLHEAVRYGDLSTSWEAVDIIRNGDRLAEILCDVIRHHGPGAVGEAIRIAVEKGLKGRNLRVVLRDAIDAGSLDTAKEAMRIGVEKGLEGEDLRRVLCSAADRTDQNLAISAMQIAVEKGLEGDSLLYILYAGAKKTSCNDTLRILLASWNKITTLSRLIYVQTLLGSWLAHHGVYLTHYIDPDETPEVRRKTILNILERFHLKNHDDHVKLVSILKSLKFEKPPKPTRLSKADVNQVYNIGWPIKIVGLLRKFRSLTKEVLKR